MCLHNLFSFNSFKTQIVKIHGSGRDKQLYETAIAKLISFMGEADISQDSGLILSKLRDKNCDKERMHAQEVILRNTFRDRLDRLLLQCLKVVDIRI